MSDPVYCIATDALWAWARPVAAFVDLPDVLALRQVCRAFAGKAGMKLLRHHAAAVDPAGFLAKRVCEDFPLPGDEAWAAQASAVAMAEGPAAPTPKPTHSYPEEAASSGASACSAHGGAAAAAAGASSGLDEESTAVDALLVRNLRARRLMTSAYGEYGVMWGNSPEYYRPETPVHGQKLYSKILLCPLVFWLDVGKHIDGTVSAFPERFLLASVHRDRRGVGKSCNVQVTVTDSGGKNHDSHIDNVESLRHPSSIKHDMFIAPLANVVVSSNCRATLVRFWSHTGTSCRGSTEAFVLIPMGRATETPDEPATMTRVADAMAAVRTVAAFLAPFVH